ncbi:MAG: hypothetical protein QOH02_164 [Gaiellaceae bacterium]|nr:hypothetical protein [Gaiellaceae bacterium]
MTAETVPLHITNGDSVVRTLGKTSIEGERVSWLDVLHEGPLADVPPDELRKLRAGFLAAHGWGDAQEIEADLRGRDELLADAVRAGRPIVLWFEHDLFDQLQLIQILAALGDARPGQVSLVQANVYLGTLQPAELERLEPGPVSRSALELGGDAWRAVCAGKIEAFLARDTSALPYLAPALRRLLEERRDLSRTKRQILAALAGGPKERSELFAANQAAEEAIFLGDTWFFVRLDELAKDGLVAEAEAVELTPRGRELV